MRFTDLASPSKQILQACFYVSSITGLLEMTISRRLISTLANNRKLAIIRLMGSTS
jgi:hypothetical protein